MRDMKTKLTWNDVTKIGVMMAPLIIIAVLSMKVDWGWLIKTQYFQGDLPVGAMVLLLMWMGLDKVIQMGMLFYLGYRVGRYYQKKEDKK